MNSIIKRYFYSINLIIVFIIYTLIPEINSYSKVSKIGTIKISENNTNYENVTTENHKLFNVNFIFPEKFNITSTTTSNDFETDFSGRAATEKTRIFPFSFVNSMNQNKQNSNIKSQPIINQKIDTLYPVYRPPVRQNNVEFDKIRGKGEAMDRYTPGEAVATAQFKNKPSYYYNRPQKQTISIQPPKPQQPPPQFIGPYSYKPPKLIQPSSQSATPYSYEPPPSLSQSSTQGLYAFPPNLASNYPVILSNENSSKKQTISSYLPPPAGPVDTSDSKNGFIGPINPEYLPPHVKNTPTNSDNSETGEEVSNMKDEMMNPPMKHESDMNHEHEEYHGPYSNFEIEDDLHESLPKHPEEEEEEEDTVPMPMPMQMPMPDTSMKNKPKMPPIENNHNENPPDDHDEHNHEHGHSLKQTSLNSYGSHGIDAFPHIIFDHHPSFDHHPPFDHHHEITTTERPEQPRVKKYSYFYLGRKLWYIPLYFTVWFSFYILFLIVKSIARHKVDLPNHYKQRRAIETRQKSFIDELEEVDRLTTNIMATIEDFKDKYF